MDQKQTDTWTIVLSPPIYIFQLYISPKIDGVHSPPIYNPSLILKFRLIFQFSMRYLLVMSHERIKLSTSKMKLIVCLQYLGLCLDSLNSFMGTIIHPTAQTRNLLPNPKI